MSNIEKQTELVVAILKEIENLGITDTAGYKNWLAIRDYSVKTREIVRDLEINNQQLTNQVVQHKAELEQLKTQVANLQIKLYSGKATI